MGKKWENYKKDFKANNSILCGTPGLKFFAVIFFLLLFISIIVGISLIYSHKKKMEKQNPVDKPQETEKSEREICEDSFKKLNEKLVKLGFTKVDNYHYEKGDYRNSSLGDLNLRKDNYTSKDNEEIYTILNEVMGIDKDLFYKIITSIPNKKASNYNSNAFEINKNGYKTKFDYNVEDKSMWIVSDCSWYKTNSFSYDYYKNDNLEKDIEFFKNVFGTEIKFTDLIKHMVNESKYNHNFQDSIITFHDVEVTYNYYLNEIEFNLNEKYSTNNIKYKVMRNLDNYKDILKKDLTLLDKYFNENILEYYDDIVKVIDDNEYLDGKKYNGIDVTGSYYLYNIVLNNNSSITFSVYEDKVMFEFTFKE